MNDLSVASPAIAKPSAEIPLVLNSWKEIASHLGLGVRTVQRYEQAFGLPVRRLDGKHHSSVRAYPSELNSWLQQRSKSHTVKASEASSELDGLLSRYRIAAEKVRTSIQENQRLRERSRFLRTNLHNSVATLADSAAKLMRL